jgi:hypothetical protein
VAAVVFGIRSRPGLDQHEALEVAELLAGRRNLAAARLAGKIRAQAERDPNRGETSEDIELDDDEASELAALLDEPRWPAERPAFAHLRDELRLHRG